MNKGLLLLSNNSLELFSLSLERELLVSVSVSFCLFCFAFVCFPEKAFAFFAFSAVGLPHFFPLSLLFSLISSYFKSCSMKKFLM